MSKLDRFLVSEGIFSMFPFIAALCLDRHLSDHRPILLREVHFDFGPIPFRFYHSWFDFVGFDDMIKLSWASLDYSNIDGMTRFKKKLQDLKVIIRRWVKTKRLEMVGSKLDTIAELEKEMLVYFLAAQLATKGVFEEVVTHMRESQVRVSRGGFPSSEKAVASAPIDARFKVAGTTFLVRDGVESQQWTELLALYNSVSFSPLDDRWYCDLNGEGLFRVKDIRLAIDEMFLPGLNEVTRWVNFVPIKLNYWIVVRDMNAAIENDQNVLQKHVAFFDRNKDGVIYPWETFQGFRAIGSGIMLSSFAAVFINMGLSGKTRPGKKLPNLLFPIDIEHIKMAKHGSDSGVYDTHGRFVPAKFEEIFHKYARTNPDALTADELDKFVKGNREPKDYGGWIGGLSEWKILYYLAKDKNGLLKKETIKAVYDGSLFEKMAEEKRNSSKKKHM
ncbi:caleosin-related, EF-hand domain pair containing protein [Tanacetum coccineum]